LGVAVVLNGLGQELILRPGEGQTDRFALHLAGPQIVGSFFDLAAADLAEQGAADQGALADPGGLGQSLLEVLISYRPGA